MFLVNQGFQSVANGRLNCISLLVALVWLTRPKEAFQPVFAASRHNMNVKMRHALTDAIVHCDECAVGFHCRLDCAGEKLNVPEERFN